MYARSSLKIFKKIIKHLVKICGNLANSVQNASFCRKFSSILKKKLSKYWNVTGNITCKHASTGIKKMFNSQNEKKEAFNY